MKRFLLFLLWTLVLCLLFLFSLFAADGSLLNAAALWLLLICGIYLCSLLKSAIRLLKEKKYFHKLLPPLRLSRSDHLLFLHWKKGVQILRELRRKKRLPWFILVGPRCGKSTLMTGCGQPVTVSSDSAQAVTPTRTLRWWFFRAAAFLEPGASLQRAKTGWQHLVSRIRTAPDGVVVTLAADDLLAEEGEKAEQAAQQLRLQLAPLLKQLKRRLPIYVIVTGCDTLPGFSAWLSKLSAQRKRQPLGQGWTMPPTAEANSGNFLDPLFLPLKAELESVSLALFDGNRPDENTAALLALPEEMMRLQPSLQRCVIALCETDPCSASGRPGGVWFTAAVSASTDKTARKVCFACELPEQLAALSQRQPVDYLNGYRRYLSRWGNLTVAALALLLLLICGGFTLQLLTTGATEEAAENVARLQLVEQARRHPLRYLPFLPLIDYRQRQLETRLVAVAAVSPLTQEALDRYQQTFAHADAAEQRTLILALADAILVRQAMRENASLATLSQLPAITPLLTEPGLHHLSPAHALVIQRAAAQSPAGGAQLLRLRQLLARLVSQDPQWRWLLTPDETLPTLSAQTLLPGSAEEYALSNIWSASGRQKVQQWLHTLRLAAGDETPLPVLDQFENQQPALRQQAWLKFILELNSLAVPAWDHSQWRETLLALAQGDGPALRFLTLVRRELADISERDAAPWLRQLRLLLEVRETATSGTLQKWISEEENNLRERRLSWLKGQDGYAIPAISAGRLTAWLDAQAGLQQAATTALDAPTLSGSLTNGLFQPEAQNEKNPLLKMQQLTGALRKKLTLLPEDTGINAIWTLYEQDQRLPIAYAMRQTGCWLQRQWQSAVLWPLEKNAARMNLQAQQAQAQRAISAFMRGPARSVLTLDRQGAAAGIFAGQSVALTDSFLRLVNDELEPDDLLALPERDNTFREEEADWLTAQRQELKEQQSALQSRLAEITLTSLPATVPGGARLMPTGTRLDLYCDDQRWTLKSMNFGDSTSFRWRPGRCSRVTQTILFPGFELAYHYRGEGAWPEFLQALAGGEHGYRAEEFPQQADLLKSQGIREVLVRYQGVTPDEVQALWGQWQALTQALAENSQARQSLLAERRASSLPTLSALPVRIAHCP